MYQINTKLLFNKSIFKFRKLCQYADDMSVAITDINKLCFMVLIAKFKRVICIYTCTCNTKININVVFQGAAIAPWQCTGFEINRSRVRYRVPVLGRVSYHYSPH